MPNAPILTVGQLVRELLRHRDPKAFAEILDRYAVPSHDLEPYFRWNSRHYTRTCVHRNEEFELLVICYEPGQHTSIHDYDSQLAWIHPVLGEVVEERFILGPTGDLRMTGEVHLQAGQLDHITNGLAIRRFSNHGPGRAVTLNIYAKPMSKWRVYDERTGGVSVTPAGPPR
ncbi:MAG: cysteine dioxygenase family protein [Flavobacteriales bacterium]|nr:cysteine dioxygenase family protein [Flavobacteriales bacterium]